MSDVSRVFGAIDPLPSIALDFANKSVVLCLDEFQVTDVAGVMILCRLLKKLFDYGVVLVTTSNSSPGNHYKRWNLDQ